MFTLKLLAILALVVNDAYGKCTGDKWCCKGQCGQGEGDCDDNDNCLDGLVCDFDGWFGTDYCKAGPNTKDYWWSDWGDFDSCTVNCGGDGTKARFRYCNPPVNGGYPCPSQMQMDEQPCNNGPCPIDGGFSAWDDWTECTVSCGGGDQMRTRTCDNPAPEFGGNDCEGDLSETQTCNENPCPIDGGYSDWDDWTECTVSCGGGDQSRARRCDNPAPQFGGVDCGGDLTENQPCNENPCPIDGVFGAWDEWTECTVSCGGGEQSRARRCDSPEPQFGGLDCEGELSETQPCNENPCPIDGGFSDWSDWDICTVTCGGGQQSRLRTCDNPMPEFGGADCVGELTEIQPCNDNPCPIDGGFSEWDEWTPCTADCGGGDQTRNRRCDTPAPQFGGLDCVGELAECQRCNMDPCPSTCPAV